VSIRCPNHEDDDKHVLNITGILLVHRNRREDIQREIHVSGKINLPLKDPMQWNCHWSRALTESQLLKPPLVHTKPPKAKSAPQEINNSQESMSIFMLHERPRLFG
jgi:hypothetical protein